MICKLLGHRLRFTADGRTMRWACERCGGAAGEKTYDSPEAAARYAAGLSRRKRRRER